MRNAFLQGVLEGAAADERMTLLMAEVGFSVVEPFQKQYPDRFYNTGIAEQNLVSVAAGMALGGLRPVAYSMSAFLPSRAFEQIKLDVCYQNLPVVLVSTGTGLSYGNLGATHHATEEGALMRALPNLTVLFPACGEELRGALRYGLSSERPTYISMPKAASPQLPEHEFIPGRPVCYRTGTDGTIFAVGYSVVEALRAADSLSEQGVQMSVYGLHTLKPLDEQEICAVAGTGRVFVVEEQQRSAGVGGDIARILLEGGVPVKTFRNLAIPDRFAGPVLSWQEQVEEYGLSAPGLARSILDAVRETV